MKKVISAIVVLVFVLTACKTSNDSTVKTCPTDNPAITQVTDTGGVHDKSFNQGTWEGIQKYCSANNLSAAYIESTDGTKLEENLQIAADKSEVVVASGFLFSDAMYKVASKNPNTNFILIDAEPTKNNKPQNLDNVQSYYFDEAQSGYLVGYIAAATSETNRLGFVGGQNIPPVQKFGFGYIMGAQAYKEDVTIDYNYTDSFEDTNLGKTAASTMYSQGADIIFTAAGGVNSGVIQSSVELNKSGQKTWVIGVDRDMYEDGKYQGGNTESVILTSAVKKVGTAVEEGLTAHFGNTFAGGVKTLTYADGGVGLPDVNPNLEGKDALIEEAKKSLEAAGDLPHTATDLKPLIKATVNGQY